MTFGFLSGSRNFCKLLWVSCEVLFLHGYAWIHMVARSCTTTAYRWLFRDSQLSLRTLWSAVIKSQKFTARGTASPLRLLHGALVILVRLQISQFRSLGKWVWTLCLPKSSRLFVVGSEETSWEELAWEPPCNGISSSTKFSLNSCSHSGISGSSHRFPFNRGLFFIGFWDFVGLVFHRFSRSIINHFRHWHWRDVTIRCTTYIRREVFLPIRVTWMKPSKNQTNLLTHRYSNNHRCVSPAWHPNSYV